MRGFQYGFRATSRGSVQGGSIPTVIYPFVRNSDIPELAREGYLLIQYAYSRAVPNTSELRGAYVKTSEANPVLVYDGTAARRDTLFD